jgi:methylase of polypeptide subunit release factors
LTVLDVGCGSGVLSYLFAKQFKKSKIFGLDNNPDAVRTCNLNAARL